MLEHFISWAIGGPRPGGNPPGYREDSEEILTFDQARRFAEWVLRVVPEEPPPSDGLHRWPLTEAGKMADAADTYYRRLGTYKAVAEAMALEVSEVSRLVKLARQASGTRALQVADDHRDLNSVSVGSITLAKVMFASACAASSSTSLAALASFSVKSSPLRMLIKMWVASATPGRAASASRVASTASRARRAHADGTTPDGHLQR